MKNKYTRMTKEMENGIILSYKNGATHLTISEEFNIGKSSVWKIIKKHNIQRVLPPENLVGKRFNMLLVLRYVGNRKNIRNRKRQYECLCDCGVKKVIAGGDLTGGATLSCGCYFKEFAGKHTITHGLTKLKNGKDNPIYRMWRSAKTRCEKTGVPFNIKVTDIPVIPEYCPIFTWIKLAHSTTGATPSSPTLDRIIPELGYVVGNIEIISHKANTIKSYGSSEEHKLIAKYIDCRVGKHE